MSEPDPDSAGGERPALTITVAKALDGMTCDCQGCHLGAVVAVTLTRRTVRFRCAADWPDWRDALIERGHELTYY